MFPFASVTPVLFVPGQRPPVEVAMAEVDVVVVAAARVVLDVLLVWFVMR